MQEIDIIEFNKLIVDIENLGVDKLTLFQMNSELKEQRVEFKYIINSKNLNRVIDHVSKNNYFFEAV